MSAASIPLRVSTVLARTIDMARFIHAGKVALVVILAFWIAFLFDLPDTFWCLLTIPLIVRPQSGATVWRSVGRLFGTLIGCFVALFFVGFFSQTPAAMIVALCLWIFAVGFWARLESGLDSYAYVVAGMTTLVIVLDTGSASGQVFSFALARTTETVIAIASSFVVLLVVFPHSAADDVEATIRTIRALALKIGRDACDQSPQLNEADHKTAISLLAELATDLRARRYERSQRNERLSHAIAVAQGLTGIVVEAEGARRTLSEVRPEDRIPALEAARLYLQEVIDKVAVNPGKSSLCVVDAARVEEVRASIEPAKVAEHIKQTGSFGDISFRQAAALFQLRILAGAVSTFLRSEAAYLDPQAAPVPLVHVGNRYPDLLAAFESGVRPMLVFACCAALWLLTGWTDGVVLALIGGGFTLILPNIVPRPARLKSGMRLAQGFFIGAVISLLLMALLPQIEGFMNFALLIGSVILVVFYIAGDLAGVPLTIGTTVMIAMALQPSNTPSYSPINLMNSYVSLALMPVALISGLTILFPESQAWMKRHLRRATTDLLKRATARRRSIDKHVFSVQIIDILGEYGADLDAADGEATHLIDRARMTRLVGQECYRLRKLAEMGDLPDGISALVEPLIAAVRKASSRGGANREADGVLDQLRAAILLSLQDGGCREQQYLGVFRFVASAELCHILIGSGDLSPLPPAKARGSHAS